MGDLERVEGESLTSGMGRKDYGKSVWMQTRAQGGERLAVRRPAFAVGFDLQNLLPEASCLAALRLFLQPGGVARRM